MSNRELIINKARGFALSHHKNQKYDCFPYEYHLKQVADVCFTEWGDKEVIAVAWLHDVIEDTEATYKEVLKDFGENIAKNVRAITNQKNKNDTFKEISCYPIARKVKLADRFCNIQTCLINGNKRLSKKYLNEYKIFKHYLWNIEEKDFWDYLLEPSFIYLNKFLKKETEKKR